MTVVHFALVFRGVAKIDPELMLDCAPERAVAYGCVGFPGSAKSSPPQTSTPRKKGPVLDLDSENEDGDGTPAPTSPMTDDSAAAIASGPSQKDKGLEMLEALCKFCHTATGGAAGRRGAEKLLRRVLETRDFAARVELLQGLVDDAAESELVRGAVLGAAVEPPIKGRRRPRGSGVGEVASGVRVRAGAVDAKGGRYVWVRGMEGCASGRVEIRGDEHGSGFCAESADVEAVADVLERARAPRADRQCGSWLREKVRKAEVRAEKVLAAAEARRRKAEEAKAVAEVRVDGEVVTSGAFGRGRGRRTRAHVEYVEAVESEEEEPESDSDDEEAENFSSGKKRKKDDDDFVASDEDDVDESEAEIDDEDEDVAEDAAELREDGDGDIELGARRSLPRKARRVDDNDSGIDGSSSAVDDHKPEGGGGLVNQTAVGDDVRVEDLEKFAACRRDAASSSPVDSTSPTGTGSSCGGSRRKAECASLADSDVDDDDFVVA